MKKNIFTLCFLLLSIISFSQIRKKDLIGEWYSENKLTDNKINDTIVINQIPKIIDNKKCEFIKWKIENKTFKLSKVNLCSAKEKVATDYTKEKIKIRKTDFGQIMTTLSISFLYSNARVMRKMD